MITLIPFHTESLFFDSFFQAIKRLFKMPIKSIVARQIYDSRGNPTVEVDLVIMQ